MQHRVELPALLRKRGAAALALSGSEQLPAEGAGKRTSKGAGRKSTGGVGAGVGAESGGVVAGSGLGAREAGLARALGSQAAEVAEALRVNRGKLSSVERDSCSLRGRENGRFVSTTSVTSFALTHTSVQYKFSLSSRMRGEGQQSVESM